MPTSPEIRKSIFAQPILLSPVFRIGNFVGRHFYHHISGFGTVETEQESHSTGDSIEVKATWPDFDYVDFTSKESWVHHEGMNLEDVNTHVADDEWIEHWIKDMIDFQLNDPFMNGLRGIKCYRNGQEASFLEVLDPSYDPSAEE